MTTRQYRWIVYGQVSGIALLGLLAAVVLVGSIPELRVRGHLIDAMESYERGTEPGTRMAMIALDQALAVDSEEPTALMLRGRIAIEQSKADPGKLATARDAYERLERVFSRKGRRMTPALNGAGCVLLLEAMQRAERRGPDTRKAYEKFLEAINEDPSDGDAHVNAAICALNMDDMVSAAAHLEDARSSRNISYEALVAYHAAVGSLLAAAADKDAPTVQSVLRRFSDPDPELGRASNMLFRAVNELDKARGLAGDEQTDAELTARGAVAKAKLLARVQLPPNQADAYRNAVQQTVLSRDKLLSVRERQLMSVIVGAANVRVWRNLNVWTQWVMRGLDNGASPEIRAYVGMGLLYLARFEADDPSRRAAERNAAGHLRAALDDPKLPPPVRFRAEADLAVVQRNSGDLSGGLKHMTAAADILAGLERGPDAPTSGERSGFYRNLCFIAYLNRELAAAEEAARKSLEILNTQTDLGEFHAALSRKPIIAEVAAKGPGDPPLDKLPPSMPIITAVVATTAPVPIKKEDISLEIDGKPVPFVCGPRDRIYALPRGALAEGRHTIKISVTGPGGKKADAETAFDLKYNVQSP